MSNHLSENETLINISLTVA